MSILYFLNCSSVLEFQKEMLPPVKLLTPYGGRLVWTLPGKNILNVHLKDKNKIRHRKRWSQVRINKIRCRER